MNIEKLIHDLRSRINPQYYDQLGTESYERHQVVMALEYLRQENERLRENAKTISELEQLAARSNNDLLVENERLRKDAERYSFLRGYVRSVVGVARAQAFFWNCGNSRRKLDSLIDKARGAK